ncbi:hypothetical protein ACKKBG_A21390 [Auxenochlorella protothecoides x Auxenochlorella symbiontica]
MSSTTPSKGSGKSAEDAATAARSSAPAAGGDHAEAVTGVAGPAGAVLHDGLADTGATLKELKDQGVADPKMGK